MVNLPSLHISLINKTKLEVLNVLQGISRYISAIHIEDNLLTHEGIDILSFLRKRYPKKTIILDLSQKLTLTEEIKNGIRRDPIKNYILNSHLPAAELIKFMRFLRSYQKTIILRGTKFPLSLLKKYKVANLFYFQPLTNKNRTGKLEEIDYMKNILKQKFNLGVGDVSRINIPDLQKLPIESFVFSREICYSFNPIETSKQIFIVIKNEYAPHEDVPV